MSGNHKADKKAGQELCLASKALDRLFNASGFGTDTDRPLFITQCGGLTLAVVRTHTGVEVIIGDSGTRPFITQE